MRRREFLGVLGGAAAAWPLATQAQQAMPTIAFLRSTSFDLVPHLVIAFRQGLKEAGYVDGRNLVIEQRSADGHMDQLPAMVAEFTRRPVSAIAGNIAVALAAKTATTTVPIVFTYAGDPVTVGLVTSLNRPGANITGVSFFSGVLGAKRLELLRQLVPAATTIGVLVSPVNPEAVAERNNLEAAAQAIGRQLVIREISGTGDIEPAFEIFVQRSVGALMIGAGGFLGSYRDRLIALAASHRLPASYNQREAVVAGGLMSYGANQGDAYRQAGIYVGRILKGEKPGELPILQSAKFEFVINLKTAKTLGLEFHPQLLATADEVIE